MASCVRQAHKDLYGLVFRRFVVDRPDRSAGELFKLTNYRAKSTYL